MVKDKSVELMLPVYNEEDSLVRNVPQIVGFVEGLDYPVTIHIVDNASTDLTSVVGKAFAARYDNVAYTRLERKGRGHALTTTWLLSTADVVGYMDIDLSTDLSYLPDLLAPILTNQSDFVVGSRLSNASKVYNRSPKREILSRGYNALLRIMLNSPTRDAQCGFKAIRHDAFVALAPEVLDGEWFFDSEIILLATYHGLRVSELPIHWVDDRDSTVHVAKTVWQDLRGMFRMYLKHWPNSLFTRLITFGSIGLLTTLGYFMMYAVASLFLGAQASNLLTLLAMTLINTALNRRFTFKRQGLQRAHVHYLAGVVAFGLAWGISSFGIWLLFQISPGVSHLMETIWVTLLSLIATVVKYGVFAVGFHDQSNSNTIVDTVSVEKERELA